MRVTRKRGRWIAPLGVGVLLLAQLLTWSPNVQAQAGEPIDLRGFATGQPGHVGALEAGGTRVADAEVAWSAATVDADADGLKGAKVNEFNRIFQPDKSGKLSYARGSGLEVGIGTTPADPNQAILAGLAEADAAPSSTDTQEIAVDGDPVASASLVRGKATANANESGLVPDVCVVGDDLSRGEGFAADVNLLDTGAGPVLALDDQNPDRAVSQSTSRMKLVPSGKPNNYGLMSETRQTIAPVTILQGDDSDPTADLRAITIEVLGEWVLRVVANGSSGGASVFYGPGEVSPSTPILRIIDSADAVTDILSFQDVFGDEGLIIPVDPLISIAVGEDPRAIAAPGANPDPDSKPKLAADGTSASAAVDVVRIRIGDGAVGDIRIGHMEVSTEIPAGGVNCPIPVTKSADPDNLQINAEPDTSKVDITVYNVYDCDLTDTVLTDRIRQHESDPDFKIVSSEPTPEEPKLPTGVLRELDIVWNLGTIKKGESKSVTFDLQSAVHGGILRDIAEATGTFANCTGQEASGLAIAGLDVSGFSAPVDIKIETPVTGVAARRTVATGGGLAVAALGLGLFMRRRRIRQT